MKRLTLVRHAKSSHRDSKLEDIDRPLNRRGQQDAPQMAQRLPGTLSKPELLLYSPSVRTQATAQPIITQFALPPNKAKAIADLYLADLETLLLLIRQQPPSRRHLLLVGHNPGLHDLANFLLPDPLDRFPTGCVLSLNLPDWNLAAQQAQILYHDWPKKNRD